MKLLEVDEKNNAKKIDNVVVHIGSSNEGWVIFDSMNHDWSMGKDHVYRMAIAASGACKGVELTELGFSINNENELPMLVMFTSQEELMTEVKLLPSSLVDELSSVDTRSDIVQKRQTENRRCHKIPYTVRDDNYNSI